MTNIYSSTSITGFNANPPSNDGLKTAQNQADWTEQVIGKVGTPLKTAIEQINTNVAAAFAKTLGGSAATEVTTAYIIQASDQSKILYYTGSGGDTLTTPDAAAVGAPFVFNVVNAGTGTFTLDGSGSQTINGALTASFKVGQGALVFTDGANWFASNLPLDNPSLSVEQTFGGSVIDGDVVYWNTGSAYWDQAQANTANNAAVGIADANNGNVYFAGHLPDSLLTGLTPGAKYYLSDNAAGEITETAPEVNRIRVGYATNATGFVVNVGAESRPTITEYGLKTLTSGTSHDWTSLSPAITRYEGWISAGQLSGNSEFLIQLGDSGGFEDTAYVGDVVQLTNPGSPVALDIGFRLFSGQVSTETCGGKFELQLIDANKWQLTSTFFRQNGGACICVGTKTLSEQLTQIRFTTYNGTDTFVAGKAILNGIG
jgi:hypothetical protein